MQREFFFLSQVVIAFDCSFVIKIVFKKKTKIRVVEENAKQLHLLLGPSISCYYHQHFICLLNIREKTEVLEVRRVASGSFSLILDFSFLFFHPCSGCKCYCTQLLAEQ